MRVSSSSWNRKEPNQLVSCINAGSNCLVDVFFLSRKRWNCITFRRWTQRGVWIRVCCIIIRFLMMVNHDKGAFISAKQLPSLHPRGAKHWSPTWKLDRCLQYFGAVFFVFSNILTVSEPGSQAKIRKFIRITIGSWLFLIKNDIILGLNPWHLRQDLYVEWLQFFWCRYSNCILNVLYFHSVRNYILNVKLKIFIN
jgi:hypothetical protein